MNIKEYYFIKVNKLKFVNLLFAKTTLLYCKECIIKKYLLTSISQLIKQIFVLFLTCYNLPFMILEFVTFVYMHLM